MSLQKLLSSMRRAVNDYGMIEDGDSIAVGLSGGKDSIALLSALAAYRRFSPQPFSLKAITVDMGMGADYSPLKDFCAGLDVPYRIIETDIGEIIFNVRKEKSPCSLCSKMRRGALNSAVIEENCNKLALGHHADDVAETFLLSLLYEGRLSTFSPISFMSRSGVTLIRPFIYVEEKDIVPFTRSLPVVHNPCPSNHVTQREYMKNLLKRLNSDIPRAKDSIMTALFNPLRNNLWDKVARPNRDDAPPETSDATAKEQKTKLRPTAQTTENGSGND